VLLLVAHLGQTAELLLEVKELNFIWHVFDEATKMILISSNVEKTGKETKAKSSFGFADLPFN
jgi:hypothetical protein